MSYLSVDLDYWILERDDASSLRFFERIFWSDVQIDFVESHEELLEFVNLKNYGKLINVDWHSDLVEASCSHLELEEGSWVNYVDWKASGAYEWIYPCDVRWSFSSGNCYHKEDPFRDGLCDWGSVSRSPNLEIDFGEVERVGVSFSPNWVNVLSVQRVLKELMSRDDQVKTVLQRYVEALVNDNSEKPLHVYHKNYRPKVELLLKGS